MTCNMFFLTIDEKVIFMKPIDFSITINLSLTLKEDKAGINIKNVDLTPAVVSLPVRLNSRYGKATSKTKKKTIHDIILQTAKKYVLDSGQNKFTGAKLFNLSLVQYPGLKRNTFAAQVIAAAPNHPSQRHYPNRKDYFNYLGKGYYTLNQKYLKRKHVDPAKKAGKESLSIRAGDIHRELGFLRRIPVVCSALRSRKFQKKCEIKLSYIDGLNNTTSTTFTYRLKKD